MANILCVIEQEGGEPTPCSLEVLGQGRRISSALGATLYVAVTLDRAPGYGEDDVLAKLASGGADKILLLVGDSFGTPAAESTWETHGAGLAMAWDCCQPALALIPATSGGRELAARVAARVGAAYLHNAFVEVSNHALCIGEGHGSSARVLPSELDFPVVATIPPGRYAAAAGDEEAEVEVLQANGVHRFVRHDDERRPAPLQASVALPEGFGPLPASLEGARRTVSPQPGLAIVELPTAKGNLKIALGAGAGEVSDADFAAEGSPRELIVRLFAKPIDPTVGAPSEPRR